VYSSGIRLRLQVLAGALKDNARGVIVGETTFGKGLIQTIVELSDGSGVAVTVARYQTPDGIDINKKGIQPDILIDPGTPPSSLGSLSLIIRLGICRIICEFFICSLHFEASPKGCSAMR